MGRAVCGECRRSRCSQCDRAWRQKSQRTIGHCSFKTTHDSHQSPPSNQASWKSPRPISTRQLNMLPCLHSVPIYLILSKGSYSCDGISHLEGGFTLRCLQRLSLPDMATQPHAPGGAADTPAVRPSRSSRTKDSSSQISCARAG